jgi:hypothetical protein
VQNTLHVDYSDIAIGMEIHEICLEGSGKVREELWDLSIIQANESHRSDAIIIITSDIKNVRRFKHDSYPKITNITQHSHPLVKDQSNLRLPLMSRSSPHV